MLEIKRDMKLLFTALSGLNKSYYIGFANLESPMHLFQLLKRDFKAQF